MDSPKPTEKNSPRQAPPPPVDDFNPFDQSPLPSPVNQEGNIAPPPPLPPADGFNPFDAPPSPATNANPFDNKATDKKEPKDPFDFAPLPPPAPFNKDLDKNDTSVPLGNVFNTPPPTATEQEFNPFELPPPSN